MASSSAAKLEANGGDMGAEEGECEVKPDHPIAGLSPEKCYLNVIPEARSKCFTIMVFFYGPWYYQKENITKSIIGEVLHQYRPKAIKSK